MKKDFLTPIGIFLGLTLVFLSISLGSSIKTFVDIASIMITVGGSFCGLLVNYQWNQIVGVIKTTKKVLSTEVMDVRDIITILVDLARKARREGILGLEDDMGLINDGFFQKGLRLTVDAVEPEQIKIILETDMQATAMRHEVSQGVFRSWGELAPAFGMIGTLIGLIQMLAKLDDPSSIGPAMSVALLTTFYGVLLANLILNPIAGKLELLSDQEMMRRQMMLEGILAIQSGINPRILEERLLSFVGTPPTTINQEGLESDVAL
ncbi:chemotaxis protein MotA [Desulfonispora thiosulfatigenes DSM 11270]|uniref:Chemotaxis protein MotA n=1 Tax=Desulfonispora thiosulfatigenes DSM 11270 TaxID=656914 RepID=A0A1W1UMS9_DESTI|nr:MotA/TolQ/ExbB proton channel family protein [Desulfonispora thiosulfatigenes]SMB82402.1 chemotaxis protein MotA [Desulfonispora thiosulfatigenes DSM 11270]